VPLIVNCPKLVPGGRESDTLVDATDFLPTLAEFAGGALPTGVKIDGQSFAAEILGQESRVPPRGWCLTQYYKTRAVRDQRFKLYSSGEFYDLSEDPLEQHNISESRRGDEKSFGKLSAVLSGLPENASLPWEFRSISARKIRAEEAAALDATKQ